MSPKQVEQVIYFGAMVVLDPGRTNFVKKQVIKDEEYRKAVEEFGPNCCVVGMGAESLKILLQEIDLEKERNELKNEIDTTIGTLNNILEMNTNNVNTLLNRISEKIQLYNESETNDLKKKETVN